MRCWFSGRHLSRCGTLGCTILIFTPGTVAGMAQREPDMACHAGDEQRQQCNGKRQSPSAGRRLAPQDRGSANTSTAISVSP